MKMEDSNWIWKALAFLITLTVFMMAVPNVYLRAILSLTIFTALVRHDGEDPNVGTLRRTVLSAILAFAMTSSLLPLSRLEVGGLDPEILPQLILFHLSVSVWEEVVYRGYPLLKFSRTTLLTSSLAFSLIHAFNPGFGIQAFLGIFIAGLALGEIRYKWGLAPAISMHLSWNVLMEHLWGYPTSGLRGSSFFTAVLIGPDIITGGDFGPEASIVVMVEFLLLFLSLRLTRLRDHTP